MGGGVLSGAVYKLAEWEVGLVGGGVLSGAVYKLAEWEAGLVGGGTVQLMRIAL